MAGFNFEPRNIVEPGGTLGSTGPEGTLVGQVKELLSDWEFFEISYKSGT